MLTKIEKINLSNNHYKMQGKHRKLYFTTNNGNASYIILHVQGYLVPSTSTLSHF